MATLDYRLLDAAQPTRGNERRYLRSFPGIQLITVILAVSFLTGISAAAPEVPYTDVKVGETLMVPQIAAEDWGTKSGGTASSVRLRIPGVSRLRCWHKFAETWHVNVSHALKSRINVDVCFHGNASLPLLHCGKDTWRPVDKKDGWADEMSPYETVFLDIKASSLLPASSLKVTVSGESKGYRYVLLGVGLALFVMAPVVSSWVPFYYTSGITLGILLVVLVVLFQVMKLLPTNRRSTLYIAVYGTVAGLSTVVMSYMYRGAAAFLHQLGYGDDLVHPLVYLGLAVIVLLGAALGFFSVRKFVLSTEGEVDEGTSKFVLWALRIFGAVMVAQSTGDPLIGLLLVLFGAAISFSVGNFLFLLSVVGQGLSSLQLPPWPESIIPRDIPYLSPLKQDGPVKHSPVKILKDLPVHQVQKKQQSAGPGPSPQTSEPWSRAGHTPFDRHLTNTPDPRFGNLFAATDAGRPLRSPVEERSTVSPLLKSPLTPLYRSSPFGGNSSRSALPSTTTNSPLFSSPSSPSYRTPPAILSQEPGFYSTYHKLPDQKPISKEEYKDMTLQYTRTAVGDLLKSDEFTAWSLQHADRLGAAPNEQRQERSPADIQKTAHMEGDSEGSFSRSLLGRIFRRWG